MADSQETLDLRRRARRRLIGAIALVLALVIVPPWIMDLEPKPVTSNLTVEIPTQDSSKLKPPAPPPRTPAIKPGEPTPKAEAPKAPEAARSPEPPKTVDGRTVAALGGPKPGEMPKAADAAKAAPPAEDRPKVTAAAPSSKVLETLRKPEQAVRAEAILNATEGYVVSLGTFGNPDNVKQLQARLSKAGVKSYTEPVKTASGEQTRVRAGPFATREAAETAREQMKSLGIDAGAVAPRQ